MGCLGQMTLELEDLILIVIAFSGPFTTAHNDLLTCIMYISIIRRFAHGWRVTLSLVSQLRLVGCGGRISFLFRHVSQ